MTAKCSIQTFLDDLASERPTPGGGGAAGLCGAIGAALVSLVANLTIGKKNYEAVSEDLAAVNAKAEALRAELTRAIEEDVVAFNSVTGAYGLPRGTDDEKAKRTASIQAALKDATLVPLRAVKACFEVICLTAAAAEEGNLNVISDAGVAVLSANAGPRSAALKCSSTPRRSRIAISPRSRSRKSMRCWSRRRRRRKPFIGQSEPRSARKRLITWRERITLCQPLSVLKETMGADGLDKPGLVTVSTDESKKAVINAVEKAASIGEFPSVWLLFLGTVVLLGALVWKLARPVDIKLAEFITVQLIAMILLLAGAALCTHRSNVVREIAREDRLADVRLREAQFERKLAQLQGQLDKAEAKLRKKVDDPRPVRGNRSGGDT